MTSILPSFVNALAPSSRHIPFGDLYIDWSHPLTRNLKGCWIPGVTLANLVDGSRLTLLSTDPLSTYKSASAFGPVWICDYNFSLGRGLRSLGPTYLSGNPNYSIFCLMRSSIVQNGDASSCFYCERAPGGGNDIIKMTHAGSAGDSQIQITLRDDAGTLLNTTAPGTPVGDKLPHTVAMTRQGSGGGGNVIVYKDGLQTGTLNWTGTDTYTNANVVDLYDDPAAAGIPFSGMIPIAACWTRVLTPDEVVFLNSNPFAFIISSEYEMPVPFLAPTLRQKHFRFRTDTGAADATPTWGAVEDTN